MEMKKEYVSPELELLIFASQEALASDMTSWGFWKNAALNDATPVGGESTIEVDIGEDENPEGDWGFGD